MPRILLVDDDDSLRSFLTNVLTAAGYDVLAAVDGRQGLDFFHAASVDLVVTDMVMPEREGIEFILALRREQPALPIIAISGDPQHAKLFLAMAAKLGAGRVLAKPFEPAELLIAIADALDHPSPHGG